jgi:hypothetical protein
MRLAIIDRFPGAWEEVYVGDTHEEASASAASSCGSEAGDAMANDEPRPPTPYERFVEATRAILSVPKKDVEKAMKGCAEARSAMRSRDESMLYCWRQRRALRTSRRTPSSDVDR